MRLVFGGASSAILLAEQMLRHARLVAAMRKANAYPLYGRSGRDLAHKRWKHRRASGRA